MPTTTTTKLPSTTTKLPSTTTRVPLPVRLPTTTTKSPPKTVRVPLPVRLPTTTTTTTKPPPKTVRVPLPNVRLPIGVKPVSTVSVVKSPVKSVKLTSRSVLEEPATSTVTMNTKGLQPITIPDFYDSNPVLIHTTAIATIPSSPQRFAIGATVDGNPLVPTKPPVLIPTPVLSPAATYNRSNKITTVVSGVNVPVLEHKECCVCYDESPNAITTNCNHVICTECTGNLRSMDCPMCRTKLSGGSIEKHRHLIERNYQQDKNMRDKADHFFSIFLSNFNGDEVTARDLATEYSSILSYFPDLSREEQDGYFLRFVSYYINSQLSMPTSISKIGKDFKQVMELELYE